MSRHQAWASPRYSHLAWWTSQHPTMEESCPKASVVGYLSFEKLENEGGKKPHKRLWLTLYSCCFNSPVAWNRLLIKFSSSSLIYAFCLIMEGCQYIERRCPHMHICTYFHSLDDVKHLYFFLFLSLLLSSPLILYPLSPLSLSLYIYLYLLCSQKGLTASSFRMAYSFFFFFYLFRKRHSAILFPLFPLPSPLSIPNWS